jgi:2,4-dienoyl-CoA reductase-like NADH-dependent reductase (Old Yellow Enzyme family)
LLRPLIAGLALQSPYGLAPLNSSMFSDDGSANNQCLAFYKQYCRPSLGVLTLGGVAISDEGRANSTALTIRTASNARGITAIQEIANDAGVRLVVQLEHAGRQARYLETGTRLVGPTTEPCRVVGGHPHALGNKEIQDVIRDFTRSAQHVKRAGADLVEINAAHGYLLSGFISSTINTRADSYGGSVSKRFRILREICDSIANQLQQSVGIRLNVKERAGGIATPDLMRGLQPFIESIAYISVSAGIYDSEHDLIMPKRKLGENLWSIQAKQLRELGPPVFIAGNVLNKQGADKLLDSGSADVVLFGRALLADPALLDSPSPMACTDCGLCKYRTHGFSHIYCPFNPALAAGDSVASLRRFRESES